MRNTFRTLGTVALLSLAPLGHAVTQNSGALSSADFAMQPPVLTARETPLVMLGLSVDNQLFYKAYSDYTDIDSDGVIETTYDDSFDYYGYFNSGFCYQYSSSENAFVPSKVAGGANGHSCTDESAAWSGNFMNWATMTRVDVLRKVLYGGRRATDDSDNTILERTYIPSDVHAFAKVYSGSDIGDYLPQKYTKSSITFCNVSSSHPYTAASETQIRIAEGSHRRWSVNELNQCQWDAGSNTPDEAFQLNEGQEEEVRVKVCVSGVDADSDSCKSYPSGSAKPVGLLQQYGEAGDLKFGLISGSYQNYISGGVLRKNIGLIGNNPDSTHDEVNLQTGQFRNVDGVISTIDAIRIIGWNGTSYNNASVYNCSDAGISISSFKGGTRPCRDWGNPVSEIYAEAVRYFSGATSATSAFMLGGATDFISQLQEASWPGSLQANPLNVDSRCAACSIIMISSGVASFDGDELSSVSDITGISGTSDLASKTNSVGAAEYGIFPQDFLVGETSTSGNGLCTSKTLSGLGVALGICPEAPALQGSYQIAGLAHHAKTQDLRTDAGMDGKQSVDTYGVELAESVPSFEIPVGDGSIRFLPACESGGYSRTDPWQPCSLFDVEIIELAPDLSHGTLLFHWEDSSWGSDYDLDGTQVISFCVGKAGNDCSDGETDPRGTDPRVTYDIPVANGKLRITQGVAYTRAGFRLRFGYVVTGSDGDDGLSNWLVRPRDQSRNDLCQLEKLGSDGLPLMPIPNETSAGSVGCGGHSDNVGENYDYYPVSKVVEPRSSGAARLLDKPLYLAAKYGGFRDLDNSGDPTYDGSATDSREWDLVNNRTGANGPDGIPDNYFYSSNPGLLANQLQRVFESLVARTASGTNAAVVANSSSGVGAVYQALYQPQYSVGSKTVTWTGTLRAIFIDDNGFLREDSNGNAKLDGYDTDMVVQLEYDPNLEKTFVQRYSVGTNLSLTPSGQPVELNELKPIWSAVDRLAALSEPEKQRASYTSADSSRRYIFTAMDLNDDGEIDDNDVTEFSSSNSTRLSDFKEFLGLLPDATAATVPDEAAKNLIDYIRGKEIAGFRGRSIDYDGDGAEEVWRLGDIIHSTPAVVATPKDNYSVLYSDSTYAEFVKQYRDRRQVIYVGANDGMIHAFNGGFWRAGTKEFKTQPYSGSVSDHPLGQELWAYVPSNLLPHLRWLPELDYQHVYYMDGEPLVFDANIFPESDIHPHGWGTVMVMGMRFGGSPIQISVDGSNRTMRSAYVVFDVTDPEQPPKLLGEITAPDLGFTLSKPVVVKDRQPSNLETSLGDWTSPSVNDWYLVIGSGPRGATATTVADSDQPARLFAIDLEQLVDNSETAASSDDYFVTISGANPLVLDAATNGFVGGLEVVDWDRNNSDDSFYVSTVDNAPSAIDEPVGSVYRLLIEDNQGSSTAKYGLSAAQLTEMMDVGQPVQAVPTAVRDTYGDRWLLFGTGKLLVPGDNILMDQQYFYGIKEPRDTSGEMTYGSVSLSSLYDVTDVGVFERSGEVRDLTKAVSDDTATVTVGAQEVKYYRDLEAALRSYDGWKRELQSPTLAPSGRVTGSATLNPANRDSFAFTEYLPPAQSCELDGESFLYVLSVTTGTATPYAPLSTSNQYVVNSSELALSVIGIGRGLASEVTFHQGGSGSLRAITNMSTGAIRSDQVFTTVPESGRQSWRQIESLSF